MIFLKVLFVFCQLKINNIFFINVIIYYFMSRTPAYQNWERRFCFALINELRTFDNFYHWSLIKNKFNFDETGKESFGNGPKFLSITEKIKDKMSFHWKISDHQGFQPKVMKRSMVMHFDGTYKNNNGFYLYKVEFYINTTNI